MSVSRDGIHWEWPSTGVYVPCEPPGSGRSGQLYALVGMLKVGNQIFQYHTATDLGHNVNWSKDYSLEQLRNVGRIYRTVQRLDGFVSADFDASGGELVTPPLKFSGSSLQLNLNAEGGLGSSRIQDSSGNPIPGFELATCKTLKSDSTNQTVHWKKGSNLSALNGQPIRLKFNLRGAKLYAFQFVP